MKRLTLFLSEHYSAAPRPTWSGRAWAPDVIGTVAHAFQMEPCADTLAEAFTDCGEDAPLNRTTSEPDVAALDYTPSGDFQTYPYDGPSGTAPTRHMHYRSNQYVNGPSGRIMTAYAGHKHKMWGVYTPAANRGRVRAAGQTAVVEMGISHKFYRVCCLNSLDLPSKLGDSGALVAYSGTGNRHIAGMQMAKSSTTGYAWYIPANDIKMAFSNARKLFNHFWGTKSGYWKPSPRSPILGTGTQGISYA